MQVHIALHNGNGVPVMDNTAAVRVHGIFSSVKEASERVHELAREQPDVQTYIIERCMQWFPVQDPVKGSALEEEEIQAPQNNDRDNGRMGSVCDLRSAPAEPTPNHPVEDPITVFEPPPRASSSKRRDIQTQQQQLDDVLRAPSTPIYNLEQYAAARERLALLRAFARKLRVLLHDATEKKVNAADHIQQLEETHPEYRDRYGDHYEQALKQSGIPRDKVPFMKYLEPSEDPTV